MVLSHNTRGCRESATPEIERWIYRARKLTGKSAGLPGACRCDTRHEGPASAPIHTYSTPMTSDLTFAPPTPEDLRGHAGAGVTSIQLPFCQRIPGITAHAAGRAGCARTTAQGRLVAGIRAYGFLNWLHTDVLRVAEDHRGRGLGVHMLCWAEAQGRALGARHTKLETFEWQARAFYLDKATRSTLALMTMCPGSTWPT
jgi:GNAT superfamily N-acetyltransferase